MKKLIAFLLSTTMMLSVAGCSGDDSSSKAESSESSTVSDSSSADSTASSENDSVSSEDSEPSVEDTKFTLTYPESMKAQGYEDLVLDEVPQRIACTVTASVLTMYEMDASLVGIPSSAATMEIAKENPDITVLPSVMSEDFNIEEVVALNPDLVVVNTMFADSHGATLESLDIPVYYIGAGHGVGFESVKEESMIFIDAFSVDEETSKKGEELRKKFDEIEKTCKALQDSYKDKKIMVLQLGGVDMVYGQTSQGTLGSMMDMLGFVNVSDSTAAASMFQIDYETALTEQPDLLVVVGSGDAEETKTLMDEVIASNPEYWNAMTAVGNDNVLCLGVEYIAVYGIGYVDALESLIEDVSAFYAE